MTRAADSITRPSPDLVIGVGNPLRRDDGAGAAVIALLRGHCEADLLTEPGDGARLMDSWQSYRRVWVIDASCSRATAGHIQRIDISEAAWQGLPAGLLYSSSHQFGLAAALDTARALQRLPPALVVFAIEGAEFGFGEGLSAPVAAAVAAVAEAIGREICAGR